MRQIISILTIFMLTCGLTSTAPAATTVELIKRVESFDFLVDYSSSMKGKLPGTGESKINAAGKLIDTLSNLIPDGLDYKIAGIHTFATEGEALEYSPYSKPGLSSGVVNLLRRYPAGSKSSLGNGFDYFAPAYSDMPRKGAVIVLTDGEYSSGRDSLNEAKIFYLTQPDMCLHFISFADNQKAQDLIDSMAFISECSVSVMAAELLSSDTAADDFVRKVFYEERVVEIAPPPPPSIPAPVARPAAPKIRPGALDFVFMSLPFDFDSSALTAKTVNVADAVLRRLQQEPEYSLRIDGYTCTIGDENYNIGLSKRRADSVKRYLVNGGIAANRIITNGYGEASPRYDNKTREGRSLNRRVEFTFFVTGTPASQIGPSQHQIMVPNTQQGGSPQIQGQGMPQPQGMTQQPQQQQGLPPLYQRVPQPQGRTPSSPQPQYQGGQSSQW
ncbi:MAG: OmpA family protein [Deltaproteobacteria bacterium]|jgi:OOP family OmpA-OmpF porin|nr:OmpA family protein [Deltaproteobacteria bacterium]